MASFFVVRLNNDAEADADDDDVCEIKHTSMLVSL